MKFVRSILLFLGFAWTALSYAAPNISETLGSLGVAEVAGYEDMTCNDSARDEMAKSGRSWYVMCEVTRPKVYAALAWKRSEFKKFDFQTGMGGAFMSNMKVAPDTRATFECAEDSGFSTKNALKPVKVDCEYRIPSKGSLFASFLYLYPKDLVKQNSVGLVAVVSSTSKQNTEEAALEYFSKLLPRAKAPAE